MTPDELAALLASFTEEATQRGWHTPEGNRGKCWVIASAFARHAATLGHRAEIHVIRDPQATVFREENVHYNVVPTLATAVNYGDLPTTPWPTVVAPVSAYRAARGVPHPNPPCPRCGIRDIDPRTGRGTLRGHRCPGPMTPEEAAVRAVRQFEKWVRSTGGGARNSSRRSASPGWGGAH